LLGIFNNWQTLEKPKGIISVITARYVPGGHNIKTVQMDGHEVLSASYTHSGMQKTCSGRLHGQK